MDTTGSIEAQVLTDEAFKDRLAAGIPHLRGFARSLCGNRETADDLVQETMLKAWAARTRFIAGTNFKAWTFTILRNHYFSQIRRKRFVGEWDDRAADRMLAAPASQDKTIELQDLMRALQQIPAEQREALVLVAAGGMSYEDAAHIAGVAVGTIKSRVSRARSALETILESGILQTKRQDCAAGKNSVVSLLAYLEKIQARGAHLAAASGASPLRIAA